MDTHFIYEIRKLLTQPEQEQEQEQEQEPVAWRWKTHKRNYYKYSEENYHELEGEPLYTAPPKRELDKVDDGELEVRYSQHALAMDKQEYMWGFRDAEKAYGIGGE